MSFKKAAGFLILNAYPGTQKSIDELKFLVIKTSTENKWCYGKNGEFGQWDIPKGRCDRGETAIQTAMRETAEEVNLHAGVDYVRLKRFVYNSDSLTIYAAVIDPGAINKPVIMPNPVTGKKEHSSVGWCSFDEYSKIGMPSLRPAALALRQAIGAHYFN